MATARRDTARRLRRLAIASLLTLGACLTAHALWIPAKARLAQHLLHRAWARTLAGESEVKPWPWADTWPVARLRVPAHGVDLIVLDGVSGRTLAFGPGHASASPRPGEPGTAIITAHRDTHFRFLERVKPGDEIVAELPRRPASRFTVREVVAAVDSRTAAIASAPPSASLVLLTCYPFDAIAPGGPLRYLVIADASPRDWRARRLRKPRRLG